MLNALPDPATLPLEQLVAQMFVVRASGHLFDEQIRYPAWEPTRSTLQTLIQDWGIGGVLLIDGSAPEVALRTAELRSWSRLPLLICADIEEGVGQRFDGATALPPLMALGELAKQPELRDRALVLAQQMGATTAQEALAIGIDWLLAPVVDVNNNPANPVINVRSFGADPAIVADLASAFIAGAQTFPVLTTAKHFPGHGDTSVDSHWELPTLPHSRARLASVELPPFQKAIAAGVDAVMTAHLRVPAWDNTHPATLSQVLSYQVLREQLGFEGLVVTDALVMGAITRQYSNESAIFGAIEAGADIILMPEDAIGGMQAVCAAVKSGRWLSRDRLEASVRRIFAAKAKLQANITPAASKTAFGQENATPDLASSANPATNPPAQLQASVQAQLQAQVAVPAARELDQEILQTSLRSQGRFPLVPRSLTQPAATPPKLQNVVILDDLLRCRVLGHHRAAIAVPQQAGYDLLMLDTASFRDPPSNLPDLNSEVILQVLVRGNPFGSSAALASLAQRWLEAAIAARCLAGLVVYGSPYVFEQFTAIIRERAIDPAAISQLFSFSQTPAAQTLVMERLFGSATVEWRGFKPHA